MRRKTSLFVILLSALLMVSMMSAMAFAKDKKEEPKKEKTEKHAVKEGGFSVQELSAPLYVGGIGVFDNDDDIEGACSEGKASVVFNEDKTAATLTLDGAKIGARYKVDEYYTNIHSEDIDLTIVLNGDNVVGDTDSLADYAIDVCSDEQGDNLTIQGSGTLTVESEDCAIYADNDINITEGTVTATVNEDNAIYADNDINITEGTVTATVNEGGDHSDTICASNNIVISGASVTAEANFVENAESCTAICADYGKAEISGGTVTATVSGSKLYDCDAIYAEEDISITGGYVTATVTGGYDGCDAICADEDDVAISGNGTKVTATTDMGYAIYGNNVSIANGSDVTAISEIYALMADKVEGKGGNVTIDSSKVTVDGTYEGVIAYGNIDIKDSEMKDTKGQIWTRGKLTVQDSRVSATASNNVLFGRGGVDIKYTGAGKYSTYVEAIANGLEQSGLSTNDSGYKGVAIHAAKGKLNIDDKLSITKPEGGAKGDYGEGDREFTTVLYDGKPAGHVIIEVAKPAPTPTPTPAANVPTVKTTAKTSARSMTVKWTWNNVPGAKSYKVSYHKVGSKKWTTKTTKKTKYVVKGHKMKGLYEYKVAAVTASGDVWSNTSCRYFKGVKTKAKAGKAAGTVRASWKKDKGANGYQVKLATNKKLNGAQVVNVSANQKSYTFSGLKSGKKYYVSVRPLKEHNGVTYQGIRCKALKVKAK